MPDGNEILDPLKDPKLLQWEAERRAYESAQENIKETDPERRKEISAIRAASDSAGMFRAKLEDKGYVLAAGRDGYCVVSKDGAFNLLHHAGLETIKFNALMSAVPLDRLPTVKEVLEGARTTKPEPKTESYDDPKLAKLMQALAEREKEDSRKTSERHAFQLRKEEWKQDSEIARNLIAYRLAEEKKLESFTSRKEADRQKLVQQMAEDRKSFENHIYKEKIKAMAALTEKQRQELTTEATTRDAERQRYQNEHIASKRILAELQEQQRKVELEKGQSLTLNSKFLKR